MCIKVAFWSVATLFVSIIYMLYNNCIQILRYNFWYIGVPCHFCEFWGRGVHEDAVAFKFYIHKMKVMETALSHALILFILKYCHALSRTNILLFCVMLKCTCMLLLPLYILHFHFPNQCAKKVNLD